MDRTIDGLLKLLYPDGSVEIPDSDIEWAARLALECRRRVKEQQKRIGSAEFRNTHFSYSFGEDGVERFVGTPEVQSEDVIDEDPLPAGQVWAISPGGDGEHAGLYRIDASMRHGSGVRITNIPAPGPFRESVRYAEGNLLSRSSELVGDRNPASHEFAVQLRGFDASRSGAFLGLPALLALCSALLGKNVRGGLVAVGGLNLGGTIDPVHDPVGVAELAVEKAASTLLIPISARRQLNELSDEMATKLTILYYSGRSRGAPQGFGYVTDLLPPLAAMAARSVDGAEAAVVMLVTPVHRAVRHRPTSEAAVVSALGSTMGARCDVPCWSGDAQ